MSIAMRQHPLTLVINGDITSMTIYYQHHVIPKHLKSVCPIADITIPLTLAEHAEAHRKLYLEYGRWQDKCAWLSLSAQIDGAEIHRMKASEANKGPKTGKALIACRENSKKGVAARRGMKDTEEVNRKRGESVSKAKKGVPVPKKRKKIIADGKIIESIGKAAEINNITRAAVWYRLKNPRFNWHYYE